MQDVALWSYLHLTMFALDNKVELVRTPIHQLIAVCQHLCFCRLNCGTSEACQPAVCQLDGQICSAHLPTLHALVPLFCHSSSC